MSQSECRFLTSQICPDLPWAKGSEFEALRRGSRLAGPGTGGDAKAARGRVVTRYLQGVIIVTGVLVDGHLGRCRQTHPHLHTQPRAHHRVPSADWLAQLCRRTVVRSPRLANPALVSPGAPVPPAGRRVTACSGNCFPYHGSCDNDSGGNGKESDGQNRSSVIRASFAAPQGQSGKWTLSPIHSFGDPESSPSRSRSGRTPTLGCAACARNMALVTLIAGGG